MNDKHNDLWQRLQSFCLDDPAAAVPFSFRLAQENGWKLSYARRVCEEYKRFVFLCQVARHSPCPSDQVDQTWHLHLTYTRSYWGQLCGQVLGGPLHHEPTRGGVDEQAKHVAMYEQTLCSYRQWFGHEPPVDIWPSAAVRFGPDAQFRRVNMKRHWVVPKPRHWSTGRTTSLAAASALPLFVAAFNPLDMRGPAFLGFFAACIGVALLVAIFMRRMLRGGHAAPAFELNACQVACLAFNERAVVNSTIAGMTEAKLLEVVKHDKTLWGWKIGSNYRLVARGKVPEDASTLEKSIHRAAGDPCQTFAELQTHALPEAVGVRDQLEELGLLVALNNLAVRFVPAALMACVLLLGAAKIIVGMQRDKPVEFLFITCVIVFIVSLTFLRRPHRTAAGDRTLAEYKQRYASLAKADDQSLKPEQVAMSVALFGVTALAGTHLTDLQLAWKQSFPTNTSGGCGGGAGGGGGCGGGGCGGGGCGVGGCGGCGGGGD